MMEESILSKMIVSDAVLSALRVTKEDIAKMDLMTFANLVFDAGYAMSVSSKQSEQDKGTLTITMESSQPCPSSHS